MKIFTLITLFFILLSFGCAKKAENQVTVTISQGLIFGGAALADFSQGGLMLWGSSSTGNNFAHALRGVDQLNLSLPNGQWTFYVMAWQNATNTELDGTGKIRCATTSAGLNGGDTQIDLSLAEATCALSAFSGELGSNITAMQYRQYICEDIAGANFSSNCSLDRQDPFHLSDPVTVMSVRVRLKEFSTLPGLSVGPGLSQCLFVDSFTGGTAVTPTSGLIFPLSNNPLFQVEFEYHLTTSDCTSAGSEVLSHSMAQNSAQSFFTDIPTSTFHHFKQINDAQLCSEGRKDQIGFAGGDGSDMHPYIICSEQQLYFLADNYPDPGLALHQKFYRLAADLNLNAFFKANSSTNVFLPATHECWDFADTWQPLGLTYIDTIDCEAGTSIPFEGSFDGNRHSIANMRMRFESRDNVAFIGEWMPSATQSHLRDLIFINPEVSGNTYVATLLAQKSSGVTGLIDNIIVEGGRLEARNQTGLNYLGGVVGFGLDLNLNNLNVRHTDITYRASYVGGVFGRLADSAFAKSLHSSAHLRLSYRSNMTSDWIGGVGGYFTSTVITGSDDVHSWSHNGSIEATGQRIGGIVGEIFALNGGALSDWYATSAIMSYNINSAMLGGLIGRINNNITIGSSYFAGNLIDQCESLCDRGLIYGNGDAGSTMSGTIYAYTAGNPAPAQGGDSGLTLEPAFNQLTGNSLYNLTFPGPYFTTRYVRRPNDLPRLVSEKHPCSAAPQADGFNPRDPLFIQRSVYQRGSSELNPLIICHKEQFEELTSQGLGRHSVLMTGINLSDTFTSPTIPSGHFLHGFKGHLFGFNKDGNIFPADVRSPINVNTGTIEGVKLFNIQSHSIIADPTSYHSAFVKQNDGLITNSHVLSGLLSAGDPDAKVSGFVSINNGIIDDSSSAVMFRGQHNQAGMVSHNTATGELTNSWVETYIVEPAAPFSGNYGIFDLNQGDISRISISSLMGNNFAHPNTNIFVIGNQNDGAVSDIHIETSHRWIGTLHVGPFNLLGTNNGSMTRVMNEGLLLNSSAGALPANTTFGKPIGIENGGSSANAIYSTVPSGRQITQVNGNEIACNGLGEIQIADTHFAAPYDNTFFNEIGFTGATTKQIWISVERNGERFLAKVMGQTLPAAGQYGFELATPCDADPTYIDDPNSNVQFIHSYADTNLSAEGDITTPPYIGIMAPQLLTELDFNFAGSPWDGAVLYPEFIPSLNADAQIIIDSFVDKILFDTPISLPPWEYELDYGMRLLSVE